MNLQNIKELVKFFQASDNIAMAKMALDAQADLLEAREEIDRLHEENRTLTETLTLKENLEFRDGMYWIPKGEDAFDGPYCTHCWDAEKLAMRLVKGYYYNAEYHCPKCETKYSSEEYKQRLRNQQLADQAEQDRARREQDSLGRRF